MEIVTSRMEQGTAQGIQQRILQGLQQGMRQELEPLLDRLFLDARLQGFRQGMQQEGCSLVMRQLARKIGKIPDALLEAVRGLNLSMLEELGDALLDFNRREDLEAWLREHGDRRVEM